MKKVLVLALFGIFGYGIFAQQIPTVAVATFDMVGGVTKEEVEVVTELFVTELVSSRTVNVVERSRFDKIIAEMRFQTSDWSNSQKTAAVGNAVNAQYIIRGQFMKMGATLYLTATTINVNTAENVSSSRIQIKNIDEVFDVMPNLVRGSIARIIESKTYQLGDIGPGGGFVFLIRGNARFEVSRVSGYYTWDDANRVAENFRGGGYPDWHLATIEELHLIYRNLQETGKSNIDRGGYWSSTIGPWRNLPLLLDFSNGQQEPTDKTSTLGVLAVHSF